MSDQYSALCVASFAAQCDGCTGTRGCTIRLGFGRHLSNGSPLPKSLSHFPDTDIVMCDEYTLSKRKSPQELQAGRWSRVHQESERKGQLSLINF